MKVSIICGGGLVGRLERAKQTKVSRTNRSLLCPFRATEHTVRGNPRALPWAKLFPPFRRKNVETENDDMCGAAWPRRGVNP
jgi:hypothetical protein